VERFLVDEMLMSLGRWLRMLGTDTANPDGTGDPALLLKAKKEKRVLLTRDRRLAEECKTAGVECILIESTSLQVQLKDMAKAGVKMELDPKRCTICNSHLRETGLRKGEMQSASREKTWECQGCGKLYWSGSHWNRIEETLKKVRLDKG
jgi:uncharacterized protein with PIN domain